MKKHLDHDLLPPQSVRRDEKQRQRNQSSPVSRDVNGDLIPANPRGIPLLGFGYVTKIVHITTGTG
jgi:hypothetical protein